MVKLLSLCCHCVLRLNNRHQLRFRCLKLCLCLFVGTPHRCVNVVIGGSPKVSESLNNGFVANGCNQLHKCPHAATSIVICRVCVVAHAPIPILTFEDFKSFSIFCEVVLVAISFELFICYYFVSFDNAKVQNFKCTPK